MGGTRPKTICIVSTYPPTQCGIAVYTRELVRSLQKLFPDLRICLLADRETHQRVEGTAIVLPSWDRFRSRPLFSLITNFLRVRPDALDIQFVPAYALFMSPFGRLQLLVILTLCKLTGRHSIITLHDIPFKSQSRYGMSLLLCIFSILCYRFVVHSRSMARELARYPVNMRKVLVGHQPSPAFTPNQSKAEARRLLQLDEHLNMLLFFGFISEHKGIEVAIRSMPKILSRFPETCLVIAGTPHQLDPNGEDYLREMVALCRELRVYDKTIFRRIFLSGSKYSSSYLVAADIVLFPSLRADSSYSSSSLSLAFAHGKAIAASRLPQFLEEDPNAQRICLAEPGDPDSLAEEILKILSDTGVRRRLERNSRAYAEQISWDRNAAMILSLCVR